MSGEVLHRWRFEYRNLPSRAERGARVGSVEFWRRARLLENGDVLAIFEGHALIRIDRNSRLQWAFEGGAHHDLDVDVFILDLVRYETWEDLKNYCYHVASVVGIISVEIFGYKNSGCREYAVNLGYSLQITNIMRDIGQDFFEDNRIYVPQEDLHEAGYT